MSRENVNKDVGRAVYAARLRHIANIAVSILSRARFRLNSVCLFVFSSNSRDGTQLFRAQVFRLFGRYSVVIVYISPIFCCVICSEIMLSIPKLAGDHIRNGF